MYQLVLFVVFLLITVCCVLSIRIPSNERKVIIPEQSKDIEISLISPNADYVYIRQTGKLWIGKGKPEVHIRDIPESNGIVNTISDSNSSSSNFSGNALILEHQPEYIIPSYIKASLTGASLIKKRLHKIPSIIHMSFYTSSVQLPILKAVYNTIQCHPNYDFNFYDDISCRQMLKQHFPPNVLKAYDDLVPGAYKCDLWRICVLYVYGGLYVDMRYCPLVNFDDYIDPDTDYFCVNDVQLGHIHNAVIAVVPKYPLFMDYINHIVDNIENRRYGSTTLDITGPGALGKVLFEKLGGNKRLLPTMYTKYGKIQSINFNLATFTHETHAGETIGIVKMPGCRDNKSFYAITGKKDYGTLWKERKVYKS